MRWRTNWHNETIGRYLKLLTLHTEQSTSVAPNTVQSSIVVSRNKHCLLRESDDTHEHTLCEKRVTCGATLRHHRILLGCH